MTYLDDGLRWQRAEVTLAFKSHLMRDQDRADYAAAVPRLDAESRDWLRARLRAMYPAGHVWLADECW